MVNVTLGQLQWMDTRGEPQWAVCCPPWALGSATDLT